MTVFKVLDDKSIVKTFETSKISTTKASNNRSKDFKYKSVTFAYDELQSF